MNKSQLAEAVAREARLSKIDAVKALNAFVKVAVEALRGDEKILRDEVALDQRHRFVPRPHCAARIEMQPVRDTVFRSRRAVPCASARRARSKTERAKRPIR